MNERIRELAKQAGLQQRVWNSLGKELPMWQEDPDNPGLEKFAELLIKDCASICEINGQSYKYSFTPARARLAESTSNHCGLMIKKHFGVEE